MFAALIPLALTIVPKLIDLIAGDKAGSIANTVANEVGRITGTSDPVEAEKKIQQDPQLAMELRAKLAAIAVDAQRLKNEEAANRRAAEIEKIHASLADVAGARSQTVSLAQAGSPIAWGAPVISIVITIGFFGFLIALMISGLRNTDPVIVQIVNIVVGALIAGFTATYNYWLGSSQSSREKDVTIRRQQETAAQQSTETSKTLRTLSTNNVVPLAGPVLAEVPSDATKDSDNFDTCIGVVLAAEGGYVDNPADPGGATNMGITLSTLSDWRGGIVTKDDVKALTKREAREIYRANYWNPARCSDLPPGVDLMVFDFAVNAGVRTSVKLLQSVLGIKADGSVGPITLEAVNKSKSRDLIINLSDARATYYKSLHNFETFGRGWLKRTNQVEAAAETMAGLGTMPVAA